MKRLERLAATTGLSAELVGAALATPDGVGKVDATSAYRLDQLTGQLQSLQRDQTILIEMLALFIRVDRDSGPSGPRRSGRSLISP